MRKFKNKIFLLIILLFSLIRLYKPSLIFNGVNADEAVFGYNAYSILKTGKDEYGNLLPVFLRAFGDYRPPAYTYLSLPFVYLFGLNEFSTRFLSLAISFLSIFLLYKLSFLIFKDKKSALFSSFFLATSSWHIFFSRLADMTVLSGFFIALGLYFLILWLKKKHKKFLSFSFLCFIFAIYSYHNARITIPLLLASIFTLFFKKIIKFKKIIILNILFLIIFLCPLFISFFNSPDKFLRRGIYQSFWHRGDIEARLLNDRTDDRSNQPPLLTKFFHARQIYLLKEFLRRYSQHFSLTYFFLNGDPHERFRIPGIGLINLALLPALLFGIFKVIEKKEKTSLILLIWLLISPVVASQGINTPNSLHTFDSIMPYYLLIGYGASNLFKIWHKWNILKKVISAFIFLTLFGLYFIRFFYSYFYLLPSDHNFAHFFDYGMKEVVQKVVPIEDHYQEVIFIGRIYHEFLLFYKLYDPAAYQQEVVIAASADEGGFEHVLKFNKYLFPRNWQQTGKKSDALYVSDEQEVPENDFFKPADCSAKRNKTFLRIIDEVFFPDGKTAFRVFDIPKEQEKYKNLFCEKFN